MPASPPLPKGMRPSREGVEAQFNKVRYSGIASGCTELLLCASTIWMALARSTARWSCACDQSCGQAHPASHKGASAAHAGHRSRTERRDFVEH